MKNILSKKKILLLILLTAAAILAVVRRDSYYEIREYYAINVAEEKYDLMSQEEQEIRQIFVAKQSELQNVYLRFYIENLVNLDGRLIISIEDMNGNVLSSSQKSLSSLTQTETADWTEFCMNHELEKGETYTLVIKTKDVSGDGVCSLYLSRNRSFLFGNLDLNETSSPKRLEATFKYNTYCMDDLCKMLLLLLVTACLVLQSGNHRIRKRISTWLSLLPRVHIEDSTLFASRLLFFLTPCMAYYIMQTFSAYDFFSFLEQVFTLQGIFNIMIYSLFLILFYLVTNRTKYAAVLTLITTYILGLANYFVWGFRECPIVAADLASLKTAFNVAGNYDYSLGLPAVWATVLLVCYLGITVSVDTLPGMLVRQRVALLLSGALFTTGMWGIFFKSNLMKKLDITVSVWMPQRNYAKNGSALSFLLTWTYYIVEKPEDYSPEQTEEIVDSYISDTADSDASDAVTPNIIAIMNESFSDLAVDTDIETTEDYMPFIHNLTEDTVKGHLYVSVLGGNTANSEFEFLTGNSLAFFPSRSIPYNSYVKAETGSLTWTLKNQGYEGNMAIHPYYGDGWNREIVYPLLGFDDFITEADFSNETYVRDFISDESDFDRLIQEYEAHQEKSDAPFYEFTVTMQNHGGYSGTHGLVDEAIQVTKPVDVNDQVTQYLNLIHLSDQAFQNLTEYFKNVNEPTIIVMFGDHQPGFTDSVYDNLMGQVTTKLEIEDTAKMYQVPYVIWANYDIEEETLDMSANYLSSYLLNLTGSKMTGYQKYLVDLMKKLPVISAICYIGDDGIVHATGEESEYSELINEYQIVQYNNMFDTDNRISDFFFLKESGKNQRKEQE